MVFRYYSTAVYDCLISDYASPLLHPINKVCHKASGVSEAAFAANANGAPGSVGVVVMGDCHVTLWVYDDKVKLRDCLIGQ
eukprot:scaffold75447_cov19-Prasinocladus_malaysianus.AAC.2